MCATARRIITIARVNVDEHREPHCSRRLTANKAFRRFAPGAPVIVGQTPVMLNLHAPPKASDPASTSCC